MQKPKVLSAISAFEAMYPDVFNRDQPKPLRIGIRQEIKASFPEIPSRILSELLAWWTKRRAYLRACVEGAERFGLAGVDGRVTAEEAAYAATKFAQRQRTARDPWPRSGSTQSSRAEVIKAFQDTEDA